MNSLHDIYIERKREREREREREKEKGEKEEEGEKEYTEQSENKKMNKITIHRILIDSCSIKIDHYCKLV